MKTWFNNLFIAGMAVMMVACEKDEDRLTLAPTVTAPTLTSSASSVSLTSATASNEALRLNWTPADYGFRAPVQYTVQLDKQGGTFALPVTISAGSSTSLSISAADLNQNLLKLGLPAGSAGQVAVRVMAALNRPGNDANNMVYSTATTVTATPYLVVINYPSIYVPGAYQGWTPDKAPAIASVTDNKVYEGYVYFNAASAFKFTPARNWDNDYGDDGTGKLAAKGKDLTVPSAGYYLLKADLTNLTYSSTRTDWTLIGSATPNGWTADTPLTFDAATNTWRTTVALTQATGANDGVKFRANGAWDLNFGDTKADGLLDYGGENIKIPVAGTYTVVLDLSKPGNYTYTLTKQ